MSAPEIAGLPPFPQVNGVTHRFVEVNGARLHVAETGAGEPVLLVHGFPEHWYAWRLLIPRLAEDYRLLCVDMRGFGWSEATRRGYGTRNRVADVLGLLDALDLERVRLIGHEWGAWTGFMACLSAPSRFSHFLALNVTHPWPLHRKLVPQAWRFWYTALLELPLLGRGMQRTGFLRWLVRKGFVDRSALSADALSSYVGRARDPGSARAGEALHRAFVFGDIPLLVMNRHHRHRLTVPTVLLGGERDFVFSPKILPGADRFADALRVQVVPGAGHYLHEERPDLVAAAARELFG